MSDEVPALAQQILEDPYTDPMLDYDGAVELAAEIMPESMHIAAMWDMRATAKQQWCYQSWLNLVMSYSTKTPRC